MSDATTPAATVRSLLRGLDKVAIATVTGQGEPYASLVLVATDLVGRPLLLLSDLAEHTANLKADPRISLLFDGTVGLASPLTGKRASLQGEAHAVEDAALMARYVRRHPDAAGYAGFKDFKLYAVTLERAHLVAGFGRIHWLDAAELAPAFDGAPALAEAEARIVEHMNDDHADAIQAYARDLGASEASGWVMTGVDPEGADLRRAGEVLRLPFPLPALDATQVRIALVQAVKAARARLADRDAA